MDGGHNLRTSDDIPMSFAQSDPEGATFISHGFPPVSEYNEIRLTVTVGTIKGTQ